MSARGDLPGKMSAQGECRPGGRVGGGVCPRVCLGVCVYVFVCVCVCTPPPVDRIIDTRLWKHYLSATSFADGNNCQLRLENIFMHKYLPQRSCGQGYVFTRVGHSVNRRGLPQCMLGYPRGPGRHRPGPERPPGTRETPQDQGHTPQDQRDPPGPGRPLPPKQTSGIRLMSGRYTSYWNAFLVYSKFSLSSWWVYALRAR